MNKDKRVIVWRITQDCNMKCLFCSYSTQVFRKRDNANEKDIIRFVEILGEYKKNSDKEILVSWIGGEPFLWKNIIPFSQRLKNEFGIKISTTTNGLLLSSKELQEGVVDSFSEIVFSLDGFKECHDRVRQYDGHFEKVTNNIIELSKRKKETGSNLIIKINTILMRENIDYFEEFCSMLVKIGVNEVTFNQLGGFDRPEFYPENRLMEEQVEKFFIDFPKIKEKFLKTGLKIYGGENYENRIKASTGNKKISVEECNPGSWFWFINENGYISPCSYTTYEYMLNINSIKNADEIDKVEEYFKEQREKKRSKWCDDCHCTQIYDKFE